MVFSGVIHNQMHVLIRLPLIMKIVKSRKKHTPLTFKHDSNLGQVHMCILFIPIFYFSVILNNVNIMVQN